MKNVLVIGGAGYVGCVTVPKLLKAGHAVTVYDIMYYGSQGLAAHPNLNVISADMRDISRVKEALHGIDAVIHLACISNDPSFELDPALGKSINFDCFEPLVVAAKAAGVSRFVYASSSSVYGVSEAAEVTEEHPLVPLTDYSRFKSMCESVLWRHLSPDFCAVVVRPATVCGYSPRMRFDLSVNILTNLAVNRGAITVFGGSQKRPNIHIDDIADLYVRMMQWPAEAISGETFNVGYQNHTISEIAEFVRDVVAREFPGKPPIRVEQTPTDDLRSYHVCSRKIADKLGYRPIRSLEDAVRDLCRAFQAGKFSNSLENPSYFNVKTMKARPQTQGATVV